MMLTLESAPAAEPISLDDAKAQLRIDGTDEDTIIARLIDVAIAYVDGRGALGRAMITQSWAQHFHMPFDKVRVLMLPFQSLTSVEYYDLDGALQTATLADFEVVGAENEKWLRPKEGKVWPSTDDRPDAIKVTYVAGYGDAASDVPETVRHALLMLVTHWFERREPSAERALQDIPWGVEALLNMERSRWYG